MKSERKKLLDRLKGMFENDTNRNVFKKNIEYIRFPFFKNFEKDLKVNFTFPITFIVGQNGSGKSSLLHALYGAPEGKSVEEFWYTTDLDPIKNIKDKRHCFIYSYKTKYTKTKAEILKTRIKKENNPDYWEPSRPIKKYGMGSLPKDVDKREATKTRWNVLKKNVYHLDFRYSLSAYDKYFYFGSKPNTKTLKSKQDLIRKYAPKIRAAFEKGEKTTYYSRKAFNVDTLSSEERESIERILGKQYIETKFLEHNFYDRNKGFAIRYKTNNITYSEAYAGSGETAIVKLVIDLLKAENYSLVLLDEPETSLHPLAQKRLLNFILELIKKKKLQVIISTHSPDIIEDMPKEAIKIFYENQESEKVCVVENVYSENAFVHIGRSFTDKKVIIVEDELAKMIVDKVLEKNEDSGLFEVKYFPNGESIIKKEFMSVYSKEGNNNHFVIFDGDQRSSKIEIEKLNDIDKTVKNLKQKINDIVKQDIEFAVDGDDGSGREDQKIDLMLKYIKFHHNNVFFLPRNIPEEIIWSEEVLTKADLSEEEKEETKSESDYKKKFNLFAKYNLGGDTAEYQTKAYEYFLMRWIKKENNDYQNITITINKIKEI